MNYLTIAIGLISFTMFVPLDILNSIINTLVHSLFFNYVYKNISDYFYVYKTYINPILSNIYDISTVFYNTYVIPYTLKIYNDENINKLLLIIIFTIFTLVNYYNNRKYNKNQYISIAL